MAEGTPQVGSSANTYSIIAKLATGGMAELFLARNASGAGIERYVVLKRVLQHRANDAAFVRMFLDEARLAAQLQHPNIAQVYDTGVLGDSYFFTMEYVHGETLREIVQRTQARKERIPIGCALTIAANAAAGLDHAHERIGIDGKPLGIVHRDVSPSNLMVSYEGHVKVVDFGVAKAAVRSADTHVGTVKGKISYLSPEQCRAQAIDRRSDLFSLGIVMWEMFAGERLFKLETDYENMEAIVTVETPRLRTVRDDVPPEVDAIVAKLLQKEPSARFQSAAALHEAIEAAAMKGQVALSNATLGRFMKELFGRRPEPWVQMLARDTKSEAVTVTVSPGLAVAADATSSQLALVPDLTTSVASEWAMGSNEDSPTTASKRIVRIATARPTSPGRPRNLALPLVLGGIGVALAGVGLVIYAGRGGDEPSAPVAQAPAVIAIDAAAPAVAATPPADAAAPPDAAAVATVDPLPVTPPTTPPHHSTHATSPADELARNLRAACHAHDVARAQHWIAIAPSARRDELAAQCRAAGTDLDAPHVSHVEASHPPTTTTTTKPPATDCDQNPMACRR
ncbi:MAG TPA: serine/threonine-protein kinase [Kofleriaceae bacterium]|nr:serine/threonine-protein kinase [Kofleriaceae bacterium]